jgi:hydroxymethylglutaryl-CoA lyase
MADAEVLVTQLKKKKGIRYSALYLNPAGLRRAVATGRLDLEGWIPLAASEEFLRRNGNTSIAKSLDQIPEWLSAFQEQGISFDGLLVSTAFGCSYQGEITHEKVLTLVRQVVDRAGEPKEISLADTMGWASPEKLKTLVNKVRKAFPRVLISLHLHDTRGTGMANVYAGLEVGVSKFDTSIGGIGGCPFVDGAAGNVPTEDVVYLCQELGIETGVDLKACVKAAILAEEIVGKPLPGKYYKVLK